MLSVVASLLLKLFAFHVNTPSIYSVGSMQIKQLLTKLSPAS